MKLSGFSFARNADKLGYPIAESIASILPVCDEFVIAIGAGDAGDRTRDIVAAVGSSKVRIIDTVWTDRDTLKGAVYSQQTNIALSQCTGDWCFYLQADEVLHERYLDIVRTRCERLLGDGRVEGLLFSYKHFWGDYTHFQNSHGWYPYEIRIVRNNIGAQSFGDAQSFRRGEKKLRVALANAEMFHYGYVRHPRLMQRRNAEIETTYHGEAEARKMFGHRPAQFDFGPMEKLAVYKGTQPKVMEKRISEMDWKELLYNKGKSTGPRKSLKHRILTWIEKTFFGGRQVGGYKNYILLKDV
ncbi:MAG TPA: hypothetical protein VLX68_11655 [Chitinivibrionales bacterium]|nr:hypothetical protein [Chitinivibrionales bacterium]